MLGFAIFTSGKELPADGGAHCGGDGIQTMRYLVTFGYWVAAVLLLATVMVSFGYGFGRASFIASSLLPGMLAAKFFLPGALRSPRRKGIAVVSVAAGILVLEWLAMLLAYTYTQVDPWHDDVSFPPLFSNPAFLLILLAAFVIPEELLARYLGRRLPRMKRVTFISERRKVTLPVSEIAYVASNDSEVLLHRTNGEVLRTKTRISQWESLLDERFVRIHRSYLVNAEHVTGVAPTAVAIGGRRLEVSRKYRESVAVRFADSMDRSDAVLSDRM